MFYSSGSPYGGTVVTSQPQFYGIFGSLRKLIYFFQICGTVFAMLGLLVYIFYMGEISNLIDENSPSSKALVAMLLAILVYLAFKTLISCVIICRFTKNNTDADILANRFVISALSLNLGGFLTPFLLTRLPNIPVRSTINPRWFIARSMGLTTAICGPMALLAYFTAILTGSGNLNFQTMFADPAKPYSLAVVITGGIISLFGWITCLLFFSKSHKDLFTEKKGFFGRFLRFIAFIWLCVVTIELFLTMFMAIMRLFGAFTNLFNAANNSSGFGRSLYIMMAIINLMLTFYYVTWILWLTGHTIVGIWSPQGVHYGSYEKLAEKVEEEKKKRLKR